MHLHGIVIVRARLLFFLIPHVGKDRLWDAGREPGPQRRCHPSVGLKIFLTEIKWTHSIVLVVGGHVLSSMYLLQNDHHSKLVNSHHHMVVIFFHGNF